MKARAIILTLGLLVIAVPALLVAVIARPYAGPAPRGACSSQDIAAVRQIQNRYDLQREYTRRLVRLDFPRENAEQTLERHVKDALRETVLIRVRSDAYLAASFCNRTTAREGPNEVVSIPKIAAALTHVDKTDGRYLLAVCASLEAVNLRRSPEDIRAACARRSAIWDRRWKARLARA